MNLEIYHLESGLFGDFMLEVWDTRKSSIKPHLHLAPFQAEIWNTPPAYQAHLFIKPPLGVQERLQSKVQ